MITPSTMLVNIAEKAIGWKPIVCSHEKLIALVKEKFINEQTEDFLGNVKDNVSMRNDFI